ncbi:multifunctional protein ADE2-like [Haliotis cracherodii]|uniref:multifunctional protein ADE2-like n=1 Tax=Haliotis cracherodii TaxID=6455 RepID=UPI0039EBFDE8
MSGDQLKLGEKIIEGKTKVVTSLVDFPNQVLLESKDRITAGDGARAHDMEGKAAISTATTVALFNLLKSAGVKTHFIKQNSDTSFIAYKCGMIPIEWVTRRVATGSFLKRNAGVKEGYRFCPPKLETFYKDDENHDPQWSYEQCLAANMEVGGVKIGCYEIDVMGKMTVAVFEILERCWASLDCSLIDMKLEFGVRSDTGEIVLADVIDSDSWRLWPAGDRRLMKDKQVYRELKEVTPEALDMVKRNFQWVAERVEKLSPKPHARAVVIMGSPTDSSFADKIKSTCTAYGVPCELRVSSAHKSTDEVLQILAEYEGEGIPTVFVAVAGRSNGLGPVLSANSTWPVINCPPVTGEWGAQDIWSSLRLPSGLGCGTVLSPEAAGLNAAQILSLSDHVIWSKLRAKKLNTWVTLKTADRKMRDDK